jgi:hypothetical protein
VSNIFEGSLKVAQFEVIAHKSGLGLMVIDYLPADIDVRGLSEARAQSLVKTLRFAITAKTASELGEILVEVASRLSDAQRSKN